MVGDLVQLWPDARRIRVADVYWRDERSMVLTDTDGRVVYTRPDRVHVVTPRREATR